MCSDRSAFMEIAILDCFAHCRIQNLGRINSDPCSDQAEFPRSVFDVRMRSYWDFNFVVCEKLLAWFANFLLDDHVPDAFV